MQSKQGIEMDKSIEGRINRVKIDETASSLSAIAKKLYVRKSLLIHLRQHYRPYITPFEKIMQELPQNANVLDIGCGGGVWLGLLAKLNIMNYGVGLDSSKRAIKTAKTMQKNLDNPNKVEFYHITGKDKWPEGSFNVVTMVDVMHHVNRSSRRSLVHQLTKSLLPGGYFIIKDISLKPTWRRWANTLHDLVLSQDIPHYITDEDLMQWTSEAGLVFSHKFYANRLWYGHWIAVFRKKLSN